ncbi:hypothetical protein ONZ43_g1360 [Nemania bipapillata]|uniref:Uncharacterized protein n=1 Tax=Nemania bipapillata TaxID=110536 RepID=A0ACC2J4N7_9PEZI|nr:hypothetical protein ONZ43_g1360 [Nemania bipapillata]
MFLDHPHNPESSNCQWQDTQIHISKSLKVTREVIVGEQNSNCTPSKVKRSNSLFTRYISRGTLCKATESTETKPKARATNNGRPVVAVKPIFRTHNRITKALSEGSQVRNDDEERWFCKLITNRQMTQLSFVVSRGRLLVSDDCSTHTEFAVKKPSVSLAAILSATDFNAEKRLRLSYLLAEAMWHFYGSDWMLREWTKHTVHFMYQLDQSGVLVNQLFLRANFEDFYPSPEQKYRSHKFPKILALGVMLIEIELGKSIEDFRPDHSLTVEGKPTVNADTLAAMAALDNEELWKNSVPSLHKIIEKCVRPEAFQDKFYDQYHDIEGQREELRAAIVDPLGKLREVTSGKGMELDLVVPQATPGSLNEERMGISMKEIASPLIASAFPTQGLSSHSNQGAAFFDNRDYRDDNTEALAVQYFQNIEEFTRTFINSLPRNNINEINPNTSPWQRPVRVAILDSGIRLNDKFFKSCIENKRILGMESWLGQGCDDTNGHGTHVASFFLKVAPRAELYIAKVSENMEIPESQYCGIKAAIEHAVHEWKVDIISMSFGMINKDAAIDGALDMALNHEMPKIIFAAASNGGPTKARTFPASKPGVICINASDGNGGRVTDLSPASMQYQPNFVTLGLCVKWKEPAKLENARNATNGSKNPAQFAYKSGTSFATPIAAGLAANILEFARHKLKNVEVAQQRWLYSHPGMTAALARFSAPVGGYQLLCPWRAPENRSLKPEDLARQLQEAIEQDRFRPPVFAR